MRSGRAGDDPGFGTGFINGLIKVSESGNPGKFRLKSLKARGPTRNERDEFRFRQRSQSQSMQPTEPPQADDADLHGFGCRLCGFGS